MPDLTRRRKEPRPRRHIYFGDAHVGTIAKSNSIPMASQNGDGSELTWNSDIWWNG